MIAKKGHRAYEVSPLVVQADNCAEIRIRPLAEEFNFAKLGEVELYYRACEGFLPDGKVNTELDNHPAPEWHIIDGVLSIIGEFAGEQEHRLELWAKGSDRLNPEVLASFKIYSVKDDLFKIRPFRGNFHQHSSFSPCIGSFDSPGYVIGRSRQIGLDFTAVTDHFLYKPSLEAIDAFNDALVDIKIFPGEEIHPPPDFCLHIVNFGGTCGISDIIKNDENLFLKEVNEISLTLQDLPEGLDPYRVASAEWVFRKIQETGGMAILAHPYWFYDYLRGFMMAEALTTALLQQNKFDAVEIISGFEKSHVEYNNLQVMRYFEEKAKGNHFPIVGVNDSHSCDGGNSTFTWFSTIVLCKSSELDDIINGVKSFKSVAVESLSGETTRCYGEFRIVKYVHFLLREYFPVHDRLCMEEGTAMLDFLNGDPHAVKRLKLLKGRVADWQECCFSIAN